MARDAERRRAAQEALLDPCVVCYDRTVDTLLMDCMHACVCHVCASELFPRVCPICRAVVNRSARFYKVTAAT